MSDPSGRYRPVITFDKLGNTPARRACHTSHDRKLWFRRHFEEKGADYLAYTAEEKVQVMP